eukprot:CAMPEP_0168758412 /NCGR_PEP_ID=MMETSP0724-20121128/21686_1 /TAXON_ID=265536 /ORGANISM="Amphiprora sp., Strain CCMP467" /LENGTH=233 /DNA_ID=CAMNT_0008807287 /DNA_START=63 /DNA_END=764 /DNA_ORIENTATION=-
MEVFPTTIDATMAFTIDDEDDQEEFALPVVDDETTGALALTAVTLQEAQKQDASVTIQEQSIVTVSAASESCSSSPAVPATTTTSTTTTETPPPTSSPTSSTEHRGAVRPPPPPTTTMMMPTNDRYHPDMLDLKVKRKRRTAALGIVGGIAGMIVLGPIGGIAVGASAAICTTAASKRKERKTLQAIKRKRQEIDRAMEQAEMEALQQEGDVSLDLTDDTASTEFSINNNNSE